MIGGLTLTTDNDIATHSHGDAQSLSNMQETIPRMEKE
jgi:hypothetical protein